MRKLEDAASYQAGWLKYQTRQAERLSETLKTGDVYEKARATHTLRGLSSVLESSTRRAAENEELEQQ